MINHWSQWVEWCNPDFFKEVNYDPRNDFSLSGCMGPDYSHVEEEARVLTDKVWKELKKTYFTNEDVNGFEMGRRLGLKFGLEAILREIISLDVSENW